MLFLCVLHMYISSIPFPRPPTLQLYTMRWILPSTNIIFSKNTKSSKSQNSKNYKHKLTITRYRLKSNYIHTPLILALELLDRTFRAINKWHMDVFFPFVSHWIWNFLFICTELSWWFILLSKLFLLAYDIRMYLHTLYHTIFLLFTIFLLNIPYHFVRQREFQISCIFFCCWKWINVP